MIATTNYDNPEKIVEVSKNLGEPMVGINIDDLDEAEKLAKEVGNDYGILSLQGNFLDHTRSLELIKRLYINKAKE